MASTVAPASAIPMLLVDASTLQVLYAEDAGQPWHPASVTKLMTAYLAFAAIKAGRVTLDTPVTVSQHAWNQAPAKSGLEVGESVSLKDALYIMLVKSANDMAVAIAETIGGDEKTFVAQMNLMAKQMGMTATHYDNPNGLKSPGQISTARDLAIIALYVKRDQQVHPLGVLIGLVIPALAAVCDLFLLWNLDENAKVLGLVWLAVGVAYLAYLTSFFQVAPPEMDFPE